MDPFEGRFNIFTLRLRDHFTAYGPENRRDQQEYTEQFGEKEREFRACQFATKSHASPACANLVTRMRKKPVGSNTASLRLSGRRSFPVRHHFPSAE